HGFQNDRAGLARSFLEGHRAGDLECHFVGIDFVVAAVVERSLDVHHGIAGQYTAFHGFLHTLVDRLDVFLGNDAADDVVDELVTLARLVRLETNLGMAVLPASAGLANVFAFRFALLADGLAIRHLRLTDVRFDAEFAHHAVNDDFQVQLTHSADDGLAAIGIGVNFECGIFLGQLGERDAHLFLVALGLGFDGYRNDGSRELNRFQKDGVFLVANRFAGGDAAETDARADIARVNFADLFTLVGVHLQQAANALGALLTGQIDRVACLELS